MIGRVQPTGFAWVDRFRREVADPGRPPFLQEPVFGRVSWRRKGKIKGYVLEQRRRANRSRQARDPSRWTQACRWSSTPGPRRSTGSSPRNDPGSPLRKNETAPEGTT